MLPKDGDYRSASEIAEAEGITRSFVNRMMRLTLLAPDIQEAILDGRQPKGMMMLEQLTASMSSVWDEQAREICSPLIEAATRRSDEVPATGAAKLEVHPQQAVSIRCKLREYLFVDRCEPSRRSHRR